MLPEEIEPKLIIVAAPSGAGKTTIVHHLLDVMPGQLSFSISACNRKKRPNEVDGKDYYFLSTASFRKKIEAGDFVEWEEVYEDNYYGTLKSEIDRIGATGKHVIFDVDVKGALNIKKQYKNRALAIFIKPPDIASLKKRLEGRATESSASIQRRVKKAASEMKYAAEFDEIVLNDKLEEAKTSVYQIVNKFLKA